MTEREIDAQQELLQEARNQTQLLTQINWLLWVFFGLSLLAAALLLAVG